MRLSERRPPGLQEQRCGVPSSVLREIAKPYFTGQEVIFCFFTFLLFVYIAIYIAYIYRIYRAIYRHIYRGLYFYFLNISNLHANTKCHCMVRAKNVCYFR